MLCIKCWFIIFFVRAIKYHTQIYLEIKYSNLIFFVKFVFNFLKIIPYFFIFKKSRYLKYKIDNIINKNRNIYRSIVKTELPTILTLLYYIYVFTISQDIVEIYLSSFLFLTGVLIKLIKITNYWVNNNELKKDFPVFHSIIEYTLFVLLIINLLVLIIVGQKLLIMIITYLKKLFLNMDIKNKLKDLKLSLDYKWVKNKSNQPKDGNFIFDLQNKKKNKKRASFLREKILDSQNRKKDFPNTTFKQESFSKRRNWNQSINIEDNPKFTIREQLDNVKSEFKAYDNQENKFKKIVVDINKEKENFFPNESRFLFNEYVSVIKILKKNLKSVEKVLSKSQK